MAGVDETVLRTVGAVSTVPDAGTTEQHIGAFGLIKVTTTALAVGITAILGPITNIDVDGWMVYVPMLDSTFQVSASGVQMPGSMYYPFDSKAKRIVEDGTVMAIVVENAHATHAFDVAFVFRTLSQIRGTR